MTPQQFEKMLRPKLKAFRKELKEGLGGALISRIEAVEQKLASLAQTVMEQTTAIEEAQDEKLKQQEEKG